jgi:hypothetical protein
LIQSAIRMSCPCSSPKSAGDRSSLEKGSSYARSRMPCDLPTSRSSGQLPRLCTTRAYGPAFCGQLIIAAQLRRFVGLFWGSGHVWGDNFRNEVGDDLVLVRLLRVLLPRYEGPPRSLFRGDSFRNRCHSTYGVSWSTDIATARAFADGDWRCVPGW